MVQPLIKIIIGAILIVASIWWIVQGSTALAGVESSSIVTSRPSLADLITLLNGGIPPFLVLIGLLIVWLEWDGLKIQKELAAEEKKKK